MGTSFEDRIAKINAKNGGSGSAPDLPPQPQIAPRRVARTGGTGRTGGGGNPIKLLLLSFVGGLVVIGGVTFALPRILASEPVQVFADAREKGAPIADALLFSQFSHEDIKALTDPDPMKRMEAERRLMIPDIENDPMIRAGIASYIKKEGLDLTVDDVLRMNGL